MTARNPHTRHCDTSDPHGGQQWRRQVEAVYGVNVWIIRACYSQFHTIIDKRSRDGITPPTHSHPTILTPLYSNDCVQTWRVLRQPVTAAVCLGHTRFLTAMYAGLFITDCILALLPSITSFPHPASLTAIDNIPPPPPLTFPLRGSEDSLRAEVGHKPRQSHHHPAVRPHRRSSIRATLPTVGVRVLLPSSPPRSELSLPLLVFLPPNTVPLFSKW